MVKWYLQAAPVTFFSLVCPAHGGSKGCWECGIPDLFKQCGVLCRLSWLKAPEENRRKTEEATADQGERPPERCSRSPETWRSRRRRLAIEKQERRDGQAPLLGAGGLHACLHDGVAVLSH